MTQVKRWVAVVVLLASGAVSGAWLASTEPAWGQGRTTPPEAVLKSGSQLSLPILQQIATTLQQIDARLARLETVAQKMQTPRRGLIDSER